MTYEILLYCICAVIVLLAVAGPLVNILFRLPAKTKGGSDSRPSFSIVIPVHDNAAELERNLPRFLNQEYDGDFEVIVVESRTGDRTEEVIKRFSDDRLYHTFIPSGSKYMSRKKLAMTVGAKAAANEWIIFADAACFPKTDKWLSAVASHCDDKKDLVTGYGNYSEGTKDFYRFTRLINALYALRRAVRGKAYRASADWVGIRRNVFMEGKGFEGNLMYIRGEFDFLVNKYAAVGNTAVVTCPEAFTETEEPTEKTWKNTNLFYMDTRKHLGGGFRYRAARAADTVMIYLPYMLFAAAITAGIMLPDILLLVTAAAAMIIFIVLRLFIARKALYLYDTAIPLWKVIPFEIMILLNNIRFRIKYKFSDKYDFTCHKL